MTLLLKSVWRNVLRASHSTFSTRSLASSISELPSVKSPDTVMTNIRSARSTAAVLAAVQQHLHQMDHTHMLQALKILFEMNKSKRPHEETENIVKDPTFNVLCQSFKRHARKLDLNEVIEATKVLTYLRVPVDSLIVQTLLQLVRCNLNFMNIRQVMFLDFLLSRFETHNHLVDALRLALPLVFQIHMPLEIDNQDLPLLRDMLAYACSHDLPNRCINNIVTGLILHDQSINAQSARSIIWSLTEVNCTEESFPTRVQLLHICYDILSQCLDQLSYDDVLRTIAKIKGRILEKHSEYYHEQLMDAVANYVIKNNLDLDKSLLIARVLSRIAHTHLGLVEYICQVAASEPDTLTNARTNILFGFVNCLSNCNYVPQQDIWDELRRQISANGILNGQNTSLPWTKFCLELASLGHFEPKLLSKIFSKEYLAEYLNKPKNQLDYLQLLTLHEAVVSFYSEEYKLPEEILQEARNFYPVHTVADQLDMYLIKGLGGPEFCVKNVALRNGFVVDVLLCLKNGYPISLTCDDRKDNKVSIDELNLPDDGLVVSVMLFHQGCFSMNSNRLRGTFRLVLDILEKQGYMPIGVNLNEWLNAPAHERTPYIMREIGYKCGEIGMKLQI